MNRRIVLKKQAWQILTVLLLASVAGCQTSQAEQGTPSSTIPTAQPAVSSPTTPRLDRLILVDRLPGWESVSESTAKALEEYGLSRGWEFNIYSEIPAPNLLDEARLVVLLGGSPDLPGLSTINQDTRLLAIAIPGLRATENMAVIGAEGMRPDQAAFVSGYIAAAITPDWRIGVIGYGDSGEGQAALQAFIKGGVFFCGLCRPAYPPFHTYPASITVLRSSPNPIVEGSTSLNGQAVTTIALTHEFSEETILGIPNGGSKQLWIGPVAPPVDNRGSWLATVRPDPAREIVAVLERLMNAEADIEIPMPMAIFDVNEQLVSEGKLRLFREMIDDLERGIIDTGVDPVSGLEN